MFIADSLGLDFLNSIATPVDVPVDSTFVLYINDGVARIVFQHERDEFQDTLRASGVLPAR